MRHPASLRACLVACAVVLAGCGAGGAPEAAGPGSDARFPMTVSNCGRQVTIEQPPKRVFAERDTSTALAAAGAADRIVARSGGGDVPLGRYRDQLARVPQITKNSAEAPSPEVVVGQRADLVTAGHVERQDVQELEAVGVPVIVPEWFCSQVFGNKRSVGFTDTYRTLRTLGRVFGTGDVANRAVVDLQRRVAAVQRRFAGQPRRTAMNVYVQPSGLQVYGGLSVNNAVLDTLGLRNVFADTSKRNVDISSEAIVARDPAVAVLSYGTDYGIGSAEQAMRVFSGKSGLGRLSAVRNNRLLALNYGYLTGGPLTVDGLEILARELAGSGQ